MRRKEEAFKEEDCEDQAGSAPLHVAPFCTDAPTVEPVTSAPDLGENATQPVMAHTAANIAERAAELFAAKGFSATSIREITEAVGVTKPTLYYHFGSKDGLVRHIHETVNSFFENTVQTAKESDLSLRDALPKLATTFFEFADTHPATVRLMLRLQHLPPDESRIADLEAAQIRKLESITQLLQRAIDAGELAPHACESLALTLLGSLSTHIIHRLRQPAESRMSAADAAREMIDLFFQGALRQPQGTP